MLGQSSTQQRCTCCCKCPKPFSMACFDSATLRCISKHAVPCFFCAVSGWQERYGPFQPMQVVEVPVWLALQLHKRNKARILLPQWLSSKQLSGEDRLRQCAFVQQQSAVEQLSGGAELKQNY